MTDRDAGPRTDFGPLDPAADPRDFERRVRAIVARAGPELARRRGRASPLAAVAALRRPFLAAAAALAVVTLSALAFLPPAGAQAVPDAGLAEALGVPGGLAGWVRSDATPSPAELLVSLRAVP